MLNNNDNSLNTNTYLSMIRTAVSISESQVSTTYLVNHVLQPLLQIYGGIRSVTDTHHGY